MMLIDWKATQAGIGALADGIPGRETLGRLFAKAAGRVFDIDPVFKRLGDAAVKAFAEFSVASPARIAGTMAETCHETFGYMRFEENLNYSAQALANTWPGRYAVDPRAKTLVPTAHAAAIAHQPQAIANETYGLRMGNVDAAHDNDKSPDGWEYRGRGMTQLTGRANYASVGAALGLPLIDQPDIAADPFISLRIACWYYQQRGVYQAMDAGDDALERQRVNGGTIGLVDVNAIRARVKPLIIPAA